MVIGSGQTDKRSELTAFGVLAAWAEAGIRSCALGGVCSALKRVYSISWHQPWICLSLREDALHGLQGKREDSRSTGRAQIYFPSFAKVPGTSMQGTQRSPSALRTCAPWPWLGHYIAVKSSPQERQLSMPGPRTVLSEEQRHGVRCPSISES